MFYDACAGRSQSLLFAVLGALAVMILAPLNVAACVQLLDGILEQNVFPGSAGAGAFPARQRASIMRGANAEFSGLLRREDADNAGPETMLLLLAGFTVIFPSMIRDGYSQFRRAADVIGATAALSVLAPVVAAAALLIKLDSPGPVLIRQLRVGMNRRKVRRRKGWPSDRRLRENFGCLFVIFKLRTMYVDAEKTGPVWARENDNRITRVGKLLRKTRIDEIPQFINVLEGTMSIIGPRPERPVFIRQLNMKIRDYAKRLQVKPGITGLAQVRYGYTATIEDTKKKLRYDLFYIRKLCPFLDTWIAFNTLGTVVSARGAR